VSWRPVDLTQVKTPDTKHVLAEGTSDVLVSTRRAG
jgi:hypothetical protein